MTCRWLVSCCFAFQVRSIQFADQDSVKQFSGLAVLPGIGSTHAEKESDIGTLAIKHMGKTGGEFIEDLMEEISGEDGRACTDCGYIELMGEFRALTDERHAGKFVIAGKRNPCDFYVSLWAWGHGRSWAESMNNGTEYLGMGKIFDFDTG